MRGDRSARWPTPARSPTDGLHRRASTATPRACRSPTTPSTASSPPRCSSTSPTTPPRWPSWPGCCEPGGTIAVTVPAWLPEKVCWALSDEYHAPVRRGRPRAHLHRARAARGRCAAPGSCPARAHHAHALHSPYWWLQCAVGPTNDDQPARAAYHRLLVWDIAKAPGRRHACAERVLNPVSARASSSTPRSRRCRDDAPPRRRRRPDRAPSSPPPSTPSPRGSCPTGMIPWFPGGHADPWNHVEAAMALALGGRRTEAERAYDWLVDAAARAARGTSTTWPTASSRTSSTPTCAPTSPPACGTTGCSPATAASSRRCGRWSSGPSTSCSTCRRPGARSSGPATPTARPWSFALLTGSSSICHSLRCAIALAEHLGHERPDWELAAAHLAARRSRTCRDAFAPKHRWAMDWYYPVLAGVVTGDRPQQLGSPSAATRS